MIFRRGSHDTRGRAVSAGSRSGYHGPGFFRKGASGLVDDSLLEGSSLPEDGRVSSKIKFV